MKKQSFRHYFWPIFVVVIDYLILIFLQLCFRGRRLNLTANAARPNPQGSFHYGTIQVVRTLILANTEAKIGGKLRYAVNSISYVDPATPLKLADWFNIPGVFTLNSIKDSPTNAAATLGTSVVGATLHDFYEIVFQNTENTVQSWHLDGYSFYVVGYVLCNKSWQSFPKFSFQAEQNMTFSAFNLVSKYYRYGKGVWNPDVRKRRKLYNLNDAVPRHTVQVSERYFHQRSICFTETENILL